jgi:hypothetical protein
MPASYHNATYVFALLHELENFVKCFFNYLHSFIGNDIWKLDILSRSLANRRLRLALTIRPAMNNALDHDPKSNTYQR